MDITSLNIEFAKKIITFDSLENISEYKYYYILCEECAVVLYLFYLHEQAEFAGQNPHSPHIPAFSVAFK